MCFHSAAPPSACIVLSLHLRELVLAMLFRCPAFWQPPSSGSESSSPIKNTPIKNRAACSEIQESASKDSRPRARSREGVSPAGIEKSPGVQSSELGSPGIIGVQRPGVQSSELKSPGVSEVQKVGQVSAKPSSKSRAPPGVMGTCGGQRPPKSPARRQVFEEKRAKRQQQRQQQQQQQQEAKHKQAAAKDKMTQARSRYAKHISQAIKEFRADHPHSSKAAVMAHAAQSYRNELQRQGLESKRAKEDKARVARTAAKQAKEMLRQAEADQRKQDIEERKQERMEKMAEGLQRKRTAAKEQATRPTNRVQEFVAESRCC